MSCYVIQIIITIITTLGSTPVGCGRWNYSYVGRQFLPRDAMLWLAVWLSGNTLASINVVALRQTRLVLGWVTDCGRVNHLGV